MQVEGKRRRGGRTFTIDGHGTVVTGSVSSGQLAVGDQLQIQPGSKSVRVRGIQNHDSAAENVSRGQRAAINQAGVHHQEIDRGHELCAADHLVPSKLMTVKLHLLDRINKPFKDRTRIRFHIGTAELFGNIRLLESPEIAPGGICLAQVYLNEPAVAVWNQPFVIRRQTPVETIAGGRVLAPNARRIKKATSLDLKMIADMSSADPVVRASASVYLGDDLHWAPEDLSRSAGIVNVAEVAEELRSSGKLIEVKISQTRSVTIQRDRFDGLADRLLKVLERLHKLQPLRFTHPRSVINVEFNYLEQPELLNLVIDELKRQKKVNANINSIGIVGYGPKLSKGQKVLLEELVDKLKSGGLTAPTVKELIAGTKKNKESVAELLEMAMENGELVKVADDWFLHFDVVDATKAKLAAEIQKAGGLTMSEIRQILDTSRKYAIPLCEHLDKTGFTVRDGDKRLLGQLETTKNTTPESLAEATD